MRHGDKRCLQPESLPIVALLLLCLLSSGLAACAYSGRSAAPAGRAAGPTATPANTRSVPVQVESPQTPAPPDLAPARIVIPKMGLDAAIVPVGSDPSGAMIAPRVPNPRDPIWSEVYWWDAGVLPGQVGNAAVAGHVNRPDASPSTFTRLDRLVPGDQITVVTAGGTTLIFAVTSKEAPLITAQSSSDPAIQRTFGPSLTPNLNLMTCWGEWLGKDFNRRLIVHSTLVGPSPFPDGSDVQG